MSVKVCITIDCEEDAWGQFCNRSGSIENIFSIPKIQEIFDKFGAVPTYLLIYQVVRSKHAVDMFKKILGSGKCEIGTHCHPWNTPPFEETPNDHNSMLCNLPYELVFKKIGENHKAICEAFGINPISFRAGRWGFGQNVAKSIASLGYKVDTSVTPLVDWTPYSGPDFTNSPIRPYRFRPENPLREVEFGGILEVPATTGFYQRNVFLSRKLRSFLFKRPISRFRILGILDRLNFLNFRWLSPEESSGTEMIRLARSLIRAGHTVLNMKFHSNSLLPGSNVFVRDRAELEIFVQRIEMFLSFAAKQGMSFVPLSGILDFVK